MIFDFHLHITYHKVVQCFKFVFTTAGLPSLQEPSRKRSASSCEIWATFLGKAKNLPGSAMHFLERYAEPSGYVSIIFLRCITKLLERYLL